MFWCKHTFVWFDIISFGLHGNSSSLIRTIDQAEELKTRPPAAFLTSSCLFISPWRVLNLWKVKRLWSISSFIEQQLFPEVMLLWFPSGRVLRCAAACRSIHSHPNYFRQGVCVCVGGFVLAYCCVLRTGSCVHRDNQTHPSICSSQNELVSRSVKGHFLRRSG